MGDAAVLGLFAQALVIGLSIAAPVGPIGLLTIQRTLAAGFRVGFATGLGAAAADAVYGAIGAYGVAALTAALTQARPALAVGGGLFLVVLGVRTWRRAEAAREAAVAPRAPAPLPAFASSFALTLSNPATILSFVAIFAALAGQSGVPARPATMVAGVFAGSALWWLLLAASVARLSRRVSAAALGRIRRVSAALLCGFGLWQIGALLAA